MKEADELLLIADAHGGTNVTVLDILDFMEKKGFLSVKGKQLKRCMDREQEIYERGE